MARGSRIVDERQVVQNVDDFYVSYNGEVRQVASGFAAQYGIIRQFWPPTITDSDPLVLTTDAEESYASGKVENGEVRSICNWDTQTGRIVLSDYDPETQTNKVKYVQAINPAPRGAGNYLWRFVVDSGDVTGSGPIGTWEDVFSDGNLATKDYWLPSSTVGVVTGQATVSISEDDGAGAPSPGTTVSKVINFKTEVTDNNLTMSTLPWFMEDIQYNEEAWVRLLTVPSGFGTAAEGTEFAAFITQNEAGKETYREEYAQFWGPEFLVKVDIVSGTFAVAESPTGVWLSTDVKRTWSVYAPNPLDDFTTVVDVSMTNGANTVVKRVTMRAAQLFEGSGETPTPGDPSEISDDFTQYDLLIDSWRNPPNPPPRDARISVTTSPNGTLTAQRLVLGTATGFPQNWHVDGPSATDPQDYECRLTVTGDAPDSGSSQVGVWLNMAAANTWFYAVNSDDLPPVVADFKEGDWFLEIREVGRPTNLKSKQMRVQAISLAPFEDGGGGGPIP